MGNARIIRTVTLQHSRYGHAPVMNLSRRARGQSQTSVKYIHSRRLISTAAAQEATRAGNTSSE